MNLSRKIRNRLDYLLASPLSGGLARYLKRRLERGLTGYTIETLGQLGVRPNRLRNGTRAYRPRREAVYASGTMYPGNGMASGVTHVGSRRSSAPVQKLILVSTEPGHRFVIPFGTTAEQEAAFRLAAGDLSPVGCREYHPRKTLDTKEYAIFTVGDRIAAARRKMGLTAMSLAHKMRVSLRIVEDWDAGRRTPDRAQRPRLAELLRLEPADLVQPRKSPKVAA
jgi:DNA-binding transcriptional regulator YiaG